MNKDLDKAKKLIELALGNPNEQESRSAALKACKHIKEKGILLALQSDSTGRTGKTKDPNFNPFEEARQAKHVDIIAKFDSFCGYCKRKTKEGTPIVWLPDFRKVFHPECWSKYRGRKTRV